MCNGMCNGMCKLSNGKVMTDPGTVVHTCSVYHTLGQKQLQSADLTA